MDLRARDLAWEFERYGPLRRCDIPAMKTMQDVPYAFVEFENCRDAEDAFYELHGRCIGEHKISVAWANKPPNPKRWREEPGVRENTAIPNPYYRQERERMNGQSSTLGQPMKLGPDVSAGEHRGRSRSPTRREHRDREQERDQDRDRDRDRGQHRGRYASPSPLRRGSRSPSGSRYDRSREKHGYENNGNGNGGDDKIAALKAQVRREYGIQDTPEADPHAN